MTNSTMSHMDALYATNEQAKQNQTEQDLPREETGSTIQMTVAPQLLTYSL